MEEVTKSSSMDWAAAVAARPAAGNFLNEGFP